MPCHARRYNVRPYEPTHHIHTQHILQSDTLYSFLLDWSMSHPSALAIVWKILQKDRCQYGFIWNQTIRINCVIRAIECNANGISVFLSHSLSLSLDDRTHTHPYLYSLLKISTKPLIPETTDSYDSDPRDLFNQKIPFLVHSFVFCWRDRSLDVCFSSGTRIVQTFYTIVGLI